MAATNATCSACFYCWGMFSFRCAIVSRPGVSFQALFYRTNYDSVNVCVFVNREILTKSPRFCVSRCIYCVLTSYKTIHNIRYALSCTNRVIVNQSGRAVGLSLCALWVRAGGWGLVFLPRGAQKSEIFDGGGVGTLPRGEFAIFRGLTFLTKWL